MEEISLHAKPRLHVHFDPNKWQATNPMHHPTVFQLNQEQLKGWAEEATDIRRKILLKAENYIDDFRNYWGQFLSAYINNLIEEEK